jgi:ribosome-associated protein
VFIKINLNLNVEKKKEIIIEVLKKLKLEQITVLKIAKLTPIADYFIICTADNMTLLRTVAKEVKEEMKENGLPLFVTPMFEESSWTVLDFGDIILHIFLESTRSKYNLEEAWSEAPSLFISS